jgi:very-short-patch-repair endonuclease
VGPALTRSEGERLMRRLARAAGLPEPVANSRVVGWEVDFLWPAQRLVVEVDGYQFHGHRTAFERDRRKGLALAAAGYRVIRISWRQLVHQPILVAAQLAQALAVGS